MKTMMVMSLRYGLTPLNCSLLSSPHQFNRHNHIDTLQYGSFAYTGLVYLNTHGEDFEGGTFTFVDEESNELHTIRPEAGMLNVFSSGGENVHRVDQVTKGVRYALTIAFTCDESQAVKEFLPKYYRQQQQL